MFVNKMLLDHGHVHLILCCLKFVFLLYYNKSWGVTPEHAGLQSSRYLPSGPFLKKFSDLPQSRVEILEFKFCLCGFQLCDAMQYI